MLPIEKRPHINRQRQSSLIIHQMMKTIINAPTMSFPASFPGQSEDLGPFVLFNECIIYATVYKGHGRIIIVIVRLKLLFE